MDYVQELCSVLNDSSLNLEGDEESVLQQFTDEFVGLHERTNMDYASNEALKKALHKIIDSNLFYRYLGIISRRDSYTMENLYRRMDTE